MLWFGLSDFSDPSDGNNVVTWSRAEEIAVSPPLDEHTCSSVDSNSSRRFSQIHAHGDNREESRSELPRQEKRDELAGLERGLAHLAGATRSAGFSLQDRALAPHACEVFKRYRASRTVLRTKGPRSQNEALLQDRFRTACTGPAPSRLALEQSARSKNLPLPCPVR